MSDHTNIEWADSTVNFWSGCTKVSPACSHCYAETLSKRNPAVFGKWGPGAPRSEHLKGATANVRKWQHQAQAFAEAHGGRRRRVFVNSMSDWLDDEVPSEWLARLLFAISEAPDVDFLLLTKRPENFDSRLKAANIFFAENYSKSWTELEVWWQGKTVFDNVWIGVTAENQAMADQRIPKLLEIPARVRFLSCEPLLGPVDLNDWIYLCPECDGNGCSTRKDCINGYVNQGIHWVIAGGESGPDARPMHPDWARSLRDQCGEAGVPFLFKQWGEYVPAFMVENETRFDGQILEETIMCKVGKKAAGHIIDSQVIQQFPV